jgi:type VI secretion system protein ImpK
MASIDEELLTGSLPDYCAETLGFACQLQHSADPGDGAALRTKLAQLFEGLAGKAKEGGVDQANVWLAGYAVVSLLDEIVLNSDWPLKEHWLGRPLQLQYFNSFNAGQEFFEKLQQVQQSAGSDLAKLEVLEVYYLCLCLGFRGQYNTVQGMETLKQLKANLASQLMQARQAQKNTIPEGRKKHATSGAKAPVVRRETTMDGLSPRWKAPPGQAMSAREIPVRAIVVACLATMVVLFAILAAVLAGSTSGALEALG